MPHHANNAYNLPSINPSVCLHHVSADNPVPSSWFAAIKAGNYSSFPGPTLRNAMQHCPSSDATVKGHLKQMRQGLRSTKPKPPKPSNRLVILSESTKPPPPAPIGEPTINPTLPLSNQLYIAEMSLSRLYTNNTGRLPIQARSGNQYITIAYHKLSNVILCAPYANQTDAHRIAAYNSIMHHLTKRGLTVDLQILDNEASTDFKVKANIEDKWKAKYQLVPPDVHRCNAAERAIQTFKSHFLAIIADLPPAFPCYLWDLLLPQTELTINLLRQSSITPSMSAWEHFNGPFDYNATLLLPLGCPVIIHNKPSTHRSWDFCSADGFYVGVSLEHYHCHRVIDSKTKALHLISATITSPSRLSHLPTPSSTA
jgi:hypothetical protein